MLTKEKEIDLCNPCFGKLKVGKIPPQCHLNDLSLSSIPQELSSLNSMEKRLICQVHAFMKLVLLPYGQTAMNGQIINFPFDIEEMTHRANDTITKPSSVVAL